MKLNAVISVTLALACPAAARAQMPDAAVAGTRALYEQVRNWVLSAAQQMPETHFSFRPTPEVRSFGQLIGHISNSQYMICSTALGESSPNQENAEQITSKAELIRALEASNAYCDRAYRMTDAKAMEPASLFGQQHNRLYALNFNVAHDYEHYGNIVTYMRLKGLVPPSTAGGGALEARP